MLSGSLSRWLNNFYKNRYHLRTTGERSEQAKASPITNWNVATAFTAESWNLFLFCARCSNRSTIVVTRILNTYYYTRFPKAVEKNAVSNCAWMEFKSYRNDGCLSAHTDSILGSKMDEINWIRICAHRVRLALKVTGSVGTCRVPNSDKKNSLPFTTISRRSRTDSWPTWPFVIHRE